MYTKNILVNCMVRRSSTEYFAIEMTKGLINNGCNVYAIIPKAIENLQEWYKIGLKKLVVIDTYTNGKELITNTIKLFLCGQYKKIKNEFKGIRIDAVYVSMINLWTGIINSMFPDSVKYITIHDPEAHTGASRIRAFIEKNIARKADYIIVLTQKFSNIIQDKYGINKDRVIFIPHGRYSFYKKYKPEQPYQYNGKVNFLFFGRIEKYKGLTVLGQAYKSIKDKYDDVSLVIAGNGDFSEYKDQYSKLKNVDLIIRYIRDEEVGSFFLEDSVIVVLPYTDATQSGVIPISMEYGCPVIASCTGGLSEQIDDGNTGILVQPNDVNSLAKAMEMIYLDKDLRRSISDNEKAKLREFDWDVLSKKLADYIEKGKRRE